jgi:nucleoid-associated protein YgaU
MRFLLFGLVVFAAGGLLGAALIRPQFIEQLWSEARGLKSRAQGLSDTRPTAPAPLPEGDGWARLLVGSAALPEGHAVEQAETQAALEREALEQARAAQVAGESGGDLGDLAAQGYLQEHGYAVESLGDLTASDSAAPEELQQIAPVGNLPPITSPDPSTPGYAEHLVRKGDTLTSITAGYYGRRDRALVEALARFNRLENANGLELGQRLTMPPLELLLGR